MSRAEDAFSVNEVVNASKSRMQNADDLRERAIKDSQRAREDKSIAVRSAFNNPYFVALLATLKEQRSELRSLLSSDKGESIGRFQCVDELIEKLEKDRIRYLN